MVRAVLYIISIFPHLLGFLPSCWNSEAARHAHQIEPAPTHRICTQPTDTHTPYLAIVQTKEFTGHALRIATISGSSSLMLLGMFCLGAAYTVIDSTNLRAYTCDRWRRSRMQVGYGVWRVFLCNDCSFFVSIMFVLRMDRGTLHRGKGDLHRSSGMRGRCWIYVCDRWKDRIGLEGRMKGRAEVVFPTYTLMLSVS